MSIFALSISFNRFCKYNCGMMKKVKPVFQNNKLMFLNNLQAGRYFLIAKSKDRI